MKDCWQLDSESHMAKEMHHAAANGDLTTLMQLSRKLDINTTDQKNRTALNIACTNGHAEVVEFLLESRAKINRCDDHDKSALMMAVECKQESCLRILMKNHANLNLADSDGNTALHLAAKKQCLSEAALLLKENPDINAHNQEGFTPLMVAVHQKHKDIVDLLLKNGADVNILDHEQRSPLMIAASEGQTDIVRLLLDFNANVELDDEDDLTAEDYAELNHNRDCADMIIMHKGQMNDTQSQTHRDEAVFGWSTPIKDDAGDQSSTKPNAESDQQQQQNPDVMKKAEDVVSIDQPKATATDECWVHSAYAYARHLRRKVSTFTMARIKEVKLSSKWKKMSKFVSRHCKAKRKKPSVIEMELRRSQQEWQTEVANLKDKLRMAEEQQQSRGLKTADAAIGEEHELEVARLMISEAKQVVEKLVDENASLHKQLSDLKGDPESAPTSREKELCDEIKALKERVRLASQQSENKAQYQVEIRATSMEKELHQVKLQLRNKDKQLDALQRERDQAHACVKELVLSLQAEKELGSLATVEQEATQKKLRKAKCEAILLRQQLEEALDLKDEKKILLIKDLDDFKGKISEAKQRVLELSQANATLQKQLSDLKRDQESSQDSSSRESDALKEQLPELAQKDKKNGQLLLGRAKEEAASHLEVIKKLSTSLSRAEALADSRNNEVHEVTLKLRKKNELLDELLQEKNQAGAHVKDLQLAVQAEKDRVRSTRVHQEAAIEKLTKTNSENVLLRQQLEDGDSRVNELEVTLQAERERVSGAAVKLAATQETLRVAQIDAILLQHQLNAAQANGTAKEHALTDAQKQFTGTLAKLYSDQLEQIQLLEENNKQLLNKTIDLQDQNYKLMKEKNDREPKKCVCRSARASSTSRAAQQRRSTTIKQKNKELRSENCRLLKLSKLGKNKLQNERSR